MGKTREEYCKDFTGWMRVLMEIEAREYRWDCKEGAVYWANLGVNVGSEQDGKGERFTRPVLVLKKFSERLILVVPSTSQLHRGPHRYKVVINGETHKLLFNQVRTIDTRRIEQFIDEIPPETFRQIRSTFADLINV